MTGCRAIKALEWDERVVRKSLTPVSRDSDGVFHVAGEPERTDVFEIRAREIAGFVEGFSPDVLVVDYLPIGLGGELQALGERKSPLPDSCKVVWGIPYTKRITRPKNPPRNPRIRRWMERFDAAVSYTTEDFEDTLTPLEPGGLPRLRHFSGYVAGRPKPGQEGSGRIVVLAGGGGNTSEMREILLRAARRLEASHPEVSFDFVVGPMGDYDSSMNQESNAIRFIPAAGVEEAAAAADLVISRCGYNSAFTLMNSEIPVIFMPQITPCFEQLDRAERIAILNGVRVVREDDANATDLLVSAIKELLHREHSKRPLPFSTRGAENCAHWFTTALWK